ncbi:MAG: chain-length determining protein [Pseudomonadota bacterium]
MQTINQIPPSNTAAASIDLMPYVQALLWSKWILLAGMIGSAALAGWMAINTPYQYVSGAQVSVVDIEDPGGVSPDNRRASEVLTLVEHGFVMGTTRDNYSDVILARLRSRSFTMHFLDSNNIYRFLYPQHWSKENQAWIGDFRPDRGESYTRFRDEIRGITVDEETEIITVSMRWPEAALPRDWANLYVRTFNEYMRAKTAEEVARKQDFLEERLRQSDVVEIQKSIYRLIEAQTAIMMLANAREEYVLEIIDPAARAYRSINMSRKKKVVVGAAVGLLLTAFAVIGLTLLRELWTSFRATQSTHTATHTATHSTPSVPRS